MTNDDNEEPGDWPGIAHPTTTVDQSCPFCERTLSRWNEWNFCPYCGCRIHRWVPTEFQE